MSDLPHDDAAARDAFLALPIHAPGPECAPAERIWRAAQGELPADEVAALLDHATGCAACVESWRLARELTAEPPAGTGAAATTTPRRKRRGTRLWGPLAALAAGIVLVALLVPRATRDEPATFRAFGPAPIESLIDASRPLARADARLAWTPGPPGTRYRLVLAGESSGVLATVGDLESAEYVVPQKTLQTIPPGGVLLWRVIATLPDGTERASITFLSRVE